MKKLLIIISVLAAFSITGCENKPKEPVRVESGNQVEIKESSFSKIDETKGLVYDANYNADFKAESYEISDKKFEANSIIVPFINIDTDYAIKANEEMKDAFDKMVNHFNEGVEDKTSYVDCCDYEVYETSDVLSVKFFYGLGATDVVHPKYFTYNINLREAMPLLYEEVCEICGISNDDIQAKVENTIREYLNESMKSFDQDEIDKYIGFSIDSYNEAVKTYTLNYCISKEGKLQIVVNIKIPAGTGEFDTLFTIE